MVTVTVSTDREVGLVAARLVAVDPDGRGHLICRGSRNLVFPRDLTSPVPPVPGEPLEVTFPLLATSAVIPAGWRLRLALAGADFPVVWPPRERFTLTLDPARSSLSLPVVDQQARVRQPRHTAGGDDLPVRRSRHCAI